MEQTNSPAPSVLNRWRAKVKTLAGNIFSPPYLPFNLILFFLLTNITHFAVTVMNYSHDYWQNVFKGNLTFTNADYHTSAIDWLVFAAVYLSLALLCLTVFNYRWSLLGWLTAEAIHLYGIGGWLDSCYYGKWSITAGKFCEVFDKQIFWILAIIVTGLVVTANLRPNGKLLPRTSTGKLTSRLSVSFAVLWIFLLLVGITASAQTPTSGWIPLEVEFSPPPLEHAAHAYDSSRNTLVVFGGATEYKNGQWVYQNETWEWDGRDWLNVSPPLKDSPQVREGASMAYDESRGVVVLYGGEGKSGALCDTWEWDGDTWSGNCPPGCPGARFDHEMYYDQIRKKVVLYGGYNGETFFNDAWDWDGDVWTKIELKGASPEASHYALAYNPDEDYAFGLLSGLPGGTWIFKNEQWSRLFLPIEPSSRGGMRLAYDPRQKVFVTFGGYSKDLGLNDTWLFDGENWSQFTDSPLHPSLRSEMILWYDEVRERVMLFGGHNDALVFNDMWELVLPDK